MRGGARATIANARELLGQRAFRNAVLAQGLGFGALFTYISTSSFVLQSGYGLTPVQFSLVFAGNGTGIVLAGQLSRAVVARTGPRSLLRAGLGLQLIGGAGLMVGAVAGAGLPVVLGLLAGVGPAGTLLPMAVVMTGYALLGTIAALRVPATGTVLAGARAAEALPPA